MSTVGRAGGTRSENGIAFGSRGGGACVAVVDPCGLRQALEACNHGWIVAFDESMAHASSLQGFDELGLGLSSVQRLAREVAAGWHRLRIVGVVVATAHRASEDAVGDGLGYKGIEPAHAFTVSRQSGSASASCSANVPSCAPPPPPAPGERAPTTDRRSRPEAGGPAWSPKCSSSAAVHHLHRAPRSRRIDQPNFSRKSACS